MYLRTTQRTNRDGTGALRAAGVQPAGGRGDQLDRDGKYLIATSDPHISAEDTALGYKNLLEAERGFPAN